jgi:hypothetical protein
MARRGASVVENVILQELGGSVDAATGRWWVPDSGER